VFFGRVRWCHGALAPPRMRAARRLLRSTRRTAARPRGATAPRESGTGARRGASSSLLKRRRFSAATVSPLQQHRAACVLAAPDGPLRWRASQARSSGAGAEPGSGGAVLSDEAAWPRDADILRSILATAIGVDVSQLATRGEASEQQHTGATRHDIDNAIDDGVAAAAVAPAAAPPRAGAAVDACLAARLAWLEAHGAHTCALVSLVQRRCDSLLRQHALLARHVAARHEALLLPPAKAARFAAVPPAGRARTAAPPQEGSEDSSAGGGGGAQEAELRSGVCTSSQQQCSG
jgi:hypothetical protein